MNSFLKLSIIFILFLSTREVVLAEACEADIGSRCYYIANSGSDENDGSFEYPWKTFENAVSSSIKPGDYIYAREGVYSERTSVYGTNAILPLTNYAGFVGDENNPIVFKSYPGEVAIMDALGSMDADASAVVIRGSDKKGIIIEDMEIRNSFGAGNIYIEDSANHIIIRKNKIYNADGTDNVGGIYLGPSQSILIENNIIRDNYKRLDTLNNNNANIFIFGGTTDIHIKNNELYNSVHGIFYKHSGYGASLFEYNFLHDLTGNAFIIASDNVTMENNLIVSSGVAFDIHEEAGCIDCTRDASIEHNTVYDSNFFVINRGNDRPGAIRTIVKNNIFYKEETQQLPIWQYGSDDDYLNNIADPRLSYNNYFSSSLSFNYFGATGLWGDLGGIYTLNQFQGIGFENNSFNSNPLFINQSGTFTFISDFFLGNNSPAINAASDGANMGANIDLVGIQSTESCSDNIQNQDETGIDCGGVCDTCVVPTIYTLTNFISAITNWLGIGDETSDVNSDGVVNSRDLGIVMSGWGE